MEQTALSRQPLVATKRRLQQLINCFLCSDKTRVPTMCPFCSKLFCEVCIKGVLNTRYDCPSCHKPLKANLTQCTRFMNQLSGLLEDLMEYRNMDELCLDHNVAQDYYCSDCLLPVCCECSFFGEHHDHTLQTLKSVYDPKMSSVRTHLQVLRKGIKIIEEEMEVLQPYAPDLRKEKTQLLTEIEENHQYYKIKILNDTLSQQTLLEDRAKVLTLYITQIQHFEDQLQQKLSNSTALDESQTIKTQLEIRQLVQKDLPALDCVDIEIPSLIEIIPEFSLSSFFVLTDFTKKLRAKEVVYSPTSQHDGNQWCLKIYSHGSEGAEGTHLSTFLEMKSSLGSSSANYHYRIEIINQKDKDKSFSRSFQSDFEGGETWGYVKYLELNRLYREGFVGSDDSLHFNYSIRLGNYSEVSKQKLLYLQSLDQELLRQERELRELEGGGNSH